MSTTENENHQTQTKFEDSLILKTLIFKLVNHNAALMIGTRQIDSYPIYLSIITLTYTH